MIYKGYINAYAMTIMGDDNYINGNYAKLKNNTYRTKEKDFSGMVFYNAMDGTFINGWRYVNGMVANAITQTVNNNSQVIQSLTNKKQVDVSQPCIQVVEELWETCTCPTDNIDDGGCTDCYTYWVTETYQTTCGTAGGGGGSGGITPPAPTNCTPPTVSTSPASSSFHGHLIINVAAPPTSPGTPTPTQPCPVTVAVATPLNPVVVKDLLSKMHTSTLTADELPNFTKTINEMDATADGDKMLTALDNYYIANPNFPTLTVTDAVPPGATDNFVSGTNTINMGNSYLNYTEVSASVYQTAHEMYHQYETIEAQSAYQSNFELDAYMFATQVIQELPSDYSTDSYEQQIEVQPATTTAQTNFNNAWGNYINGNTTISNYAILDNNFLAGSKYGPNYTTYNGQTVTNNPTSTPLFLK